MFHTYLTCVLKIFSYFGILVGTLIKYKYCIRFDKSIKFRDSKYS